MRVCFVASPLTARSGVYRSARELVAAGRAQGEDWCLILGVSRHAGGTRPPDDPEWIEESLAKPAGLRGVAELSRRLADHPWVHRSDLVVSLIPQTDMALARLSVPWVAFVRGLPWPARGESTLSRKVLWRALERNALTKASDVWATTPVLRDQIDFPGTRIVPAGVASHERTWAGRGDRSRVVWAARFDTDKRPVLFVETLRSSSLQGVMYGSGPLIDKIRATAPPNIDVPGWADPSELWHEALAYVGTSSREAFGRSAVEAAMNGIPVVLSREFGCAEHLVQDDAFARRFILDTDDPHAWRSALMALREDEALRQAYSDHLVHTSATLTIEASASAVRQRLRSVWDVRP
ncbi:MAG: glycosyltransferase [Microbacterium sp.]